jgi:hypothetical protein
MRGIMNEKTKTTLFVIAIIVLGLWGIGVSIAAGVFRYGRDKARSELVAIREAPADANLQAAIDSLAERNSNLQRDNDGLTAELTDANANTARLTGIIDTATGLANGGLQSIRNARQSTGGITNTVGDLRNNYNRLASLAIASETNYRAIIAKLNEGSTVGGINGASATGK